MKIIEIATEVLRENFLCDHCLGRIFANLLTGYSNEERGKIIRNFIALLIDSWEKIEINTANLYGIKFRNAKIEAQKPTKCFICGNFFDERIDGIVKRVLEKLKKVEFDSFLVGSKLPDDMLAAEEKILEKANVEWVEPIKAEINREIGKRIQALTKKNFDLKSPDVTVLVDLKNDRISLQIRSLYIFGKYKKLVRGIPQTKWLCGKCRGKGCISCGGKGKLYPTSVQEEIEKVLLKATKARRSAFHSSGREDIDARCLDWRPFIIELKKPIKRKINLRKLQKEINNSKKVKVSKLKIIKDGKVEIRKLKSQRTDKGYLAEVTFKNPIEKGKLKELKRLTLEPILQRTPLRVIHRRADKVRKRLVKSISWKLLSIKKLQLKIRAESGLYIKELINGDKGRTKPSVAEILGNEVKRIVLDVIKIYENK
jgi:tRNA pseudouridine synthase 10